MNRKNTTEIKSFKNEADLKTTKYLTKLSAEQLSKVAGGPHFRTWDNISYDFGSSGIPVVSVRTRA